MYKEPESKQGFNEDLQSYWSEKNITPLKMPQIGGNELDFFILYNSVCKRGGAEAVSNNKMWKEVVNELKLPPSCTSASYTLKNHYQKYLLGFELKYMHKLDDSQIPILNPGRTGDTIMGSNQKSQLRGNGDSDNEGDNNNKLKQQMMQQQQQQQIQQNQFQSQQPFNKQQFAQNGNNNNNYINNNNMNMNNNNLNGNGNGNIQQKQSQQQQFTGSSTSLSQQQYKQNNAPNNNSNISSSNMNKVGINNHNIKQQQLYKNSQNISNSHHQPKQEIRGNNNNKVLQQQQVNPPISQLGQELMKLYAKQDKKSEVIFTKKKRMFQTKTDLKRITLAFESRLQDELAYAINTLLLYSVNSTDSFYFDSYPLLLTKMSNYLEETIKNIPSLSNIFSIQQTNLQYTQEDIYGGMVEESQQQKQQQQFHLNDFNGSFQWYQQQQQKQQQQNSNGNGNYLNQNNGNIQNKNNNQQQKQNQNQQQGGQQLIQSLNVLEHYNYPVCTIMLFNQKNNINNHSVAPISLLQKRRRQNIYNTYEQIGEAQSLEQVRSIFQILRNCSYIKANEVAISQNNKLFQLIIQLFQWNCDGDISKCVLDITANVSKYILLDQIPNYKKFCEKLFETLHSDINEELESGVEILRSLISNLENEGLVENMLPQYVDSVTKLLLYSHGDIREGILEFLCYLSDQKMSTKVTLAKQPKLLMRLIGLLASGTGPQYERITKMAALTLNNIAMAQPTRQYIVPFEKDLFIVAASDASVSKLLGDILSELDTYESENNNKV